MSLSVNIRRNLGSPRNFIEPVQFLLDRTDLIIVLQDGLDAYRLNLNLAKVLLNEGDRLPLKIDRRFDFIQHPTIQGKKVTLSSTPPLSGVNEVVLLDPLHLGAAITLTGSLSGRVSYELAYCKKTPLPVAHEKPAGSPAPDIYFSLLGILLFMFASFMRIASCFSRSSSNPLDTLATTPSVPAPLPRKPLAIWPLPGPRRRRVATT